MVTNQLYIGETLETAVAFDSADIMSLVITEECSLTGEELPSDTVEAQVSFEATNVDFYTADDEQLVTADGYELQVRGSVFAWDAFPVGTNVWVYINGSLKGKYYLEYITRNEANIFTIKAQSAIWMLDRAQFAGYWYDDVPLSTILYRILRQPGDEYAPGPAAASELYQSMTIPEELRNQRASFFMRPCTIREALQAFLFANRLKLVRNNGKYFLSRLTRTPSDEIPANMEYAGGTVTVPNRIGSITVNEYNVASYYVHREVVTIPDTGAASTIYESEFPSYGIIEKDSTITEVQALSNFRFRITGYGNVTFMFQTVVKMTSVIGDKTNSGEHLTIDCTAVNSANADMLMADLWSYYSRRQEIKVATVDNREECGNMYTIASPFGESVDGYLAQNIITASGINKGEKTFITGFFPTVTEYSHSIIITESGDFQVPEEILAEENPSMRVILIGGGEGGESGLAGKNGASNSSWAAAAGGAGGKRGQNGEGGKVLSVTLAGNNIQSSYYVSIGEGGAGGAACSSTDTHNAGAKGRATTFGVYSSSDGDVLADGFTDPITKKNYAYKYGGYITAAFDGADGGERVAGPNGYLGWYNGYDFAQSTVRPDGSYYYWKYSGGKATAGKVIDNVNLCSGGCGGGAAYGNDGGNASAATVSGKTVKAPNGGNGANAEPQTDADLVIVGKYQPLTLYYGCGGLGGHGGGGGGASGCFDTYMESWGYTKGNTPKGGTGGKGGAGGKGAHGCVIILW